MNEQGLQEKLATGYQIEDPDEMTPRYRDVLVNTIHIAADLEVVTLPTYSPAIKTSPTLEDKIAVASACQDELGHAQVMYRLLVMILMSSCLNVIQKNGERFRC